MKRRLFKSPRFWLATIPLIVVAFLTSGFFRWSPLNCWHEEIDINSGKMRHTRMLLYCEVSRNEEETWLSRAVGEPIGPPDWRRVNTFSPGTRHSPHHHYHSALAQVRHLEILDEITTLDPEARRKVAITVLALWQSGSDSAAGRFLTLVEQNTLAAEKRGAAIVRASDLPDIAEAVEPSLP